MALIAFLRITSSGAKKANTNNCSGGVVGAGRPSEGSPGYGLRCSNRGFASTLQPRPPAVHFFGDGI
jgi:hypothetical protein